MNTKINKVAELMQSNHDLRDEIEKMRQEREEMETKMFNLTLENENLASKVEEYEGMIFKGIGSPSNSSPKPKGGAFNAMTVDSSPSRRRSTNKPNVRSDFFSSEDSNEQDEMNRIKKMYMEKKAQ